ncbi:MAG: UMP kinase [Planctomycetes bacterium]|nr:UMP kinase [Planctomycetota bacterium]MCB9888819.1 UMP kinase [Planctomycetota bacterium]
MSGPARLHRLLLKVSGEALSRPGQLGLDSDGIGSIAGQIRSVVEQGVEVALVLGGGNLIRGATLARAGVNRGTADHMGMLATAVNCLALQDALERLGLETRAMSAVPMNSFMEPYVRRRADRHLVRGRVVLLACGTGNPYCTTDTAAALRATELSADALFKATKVDGVYTADPNKDPNATRLDRLTFRQAIDQGLEVMDLTAFTMCMTNSMPILVFDMFQPGNLQRAVKGDPIGTWVLPE